MDLYIIGTCPMCGKINAACIDVAGAEALRESIIEFLDCGLVVQAVRDAGRVILEGCVEECPRNIKH